MSAQSTHRVSYSLFLNCIRKQRNKQMKQPNKQTKSILCIPDGNAGNDTDSSGAGVSPPVSPFSKSPHGCLCTVCSQPARLPASLWGAWRCPQPCQGPCPFFAAWAAAAVQGPTHQAPSRHSTDVLQMCRGRWRWIQWESKGRTSLQASTHTGKGQQDQTGRGQMRVHLPSP